jgi:hypothetical protein
MEPHEDVAPDVQVVLDAASRTVSVADVVLPRFVPQHDRDEDVLGFARRAKADTEAAEERVRADPLDDAAVRRLEARTGLLQLFLTRLGAGPRSPGSLTVEERQELEREMDRNVRLLTGQDDDGGDAA